MIGPGAAVNPLDDDLKFYSAEKFFRINKIWYICCCILRHLA
jgi:hypothetical protein